MVIDVENLEKYGMKIYDAIFDKKKSVEIEGVEYKIEKFSSGVRYLDLFGYRYIEQNRNKKSEWGKKAREGHQIMWIIKGRRYVAQMLDGKFIVLNKK